MAQRAGGSADPLTGSVADRTRAVLGELSPGERKVGRALLATYPVAGLETVSDLAERAKVSAPTVLRFAARLGYASYPAFQQALMREVQEQMGSPLKRMDGDTKPHGEPGSLSSVEAAYTASIAATFDRLPQAEVDTAVELLADSRLRVHLIGGRFSQVLATYLANHLVLLRKSVSVVPDDDLQRRARLIDLGKRDLLVAFDYRRYDSDTIDYAWEASRRGARVLLFTDPLLSPISEVAEAVLPAEVEAVGPFDSLGPAIIVLEAVIAAVNDKVEDGSVNRMRELEQLAGDDSPG